MTDPAKPSPESGTDVKLPAEIVAALNAWRSEELIYERMPAQTRSRLSANAARAALVAAIVKYGDERAQQAINGCASRLHEFGWPT